MSSTQAEGKGLCTVNSTQELTVLAGNRFTVNYWRDVQTTVSRGGEAFIEFSKPESNGDTTFTMKGLAGSKGYSGVLAVSSSSSYGCFGSGEWSLERLDAGPVREPATVIAQTTAPGTPQVNPPQTSKADPPPQKVQVAPTPEKQTVETKSRPADESARPLAPQSGPAPALPAIATKPVTVPAPAVTRDRTAIRTTEGKHFPAGSRHP
ncbi:MAG: hypothetical protein IPO58_08370 [Betaproteobacteria bacterium]|nr:hypothetical protein [Betaproteobacteria bacterium]